MWWAVPRLQSSSLLKLIHHRPTVIQVSNRNSRQHISTHQDPRCGLSSGVPGITPAMHQLRNPEQSRIHQLQSNQHQEQKKVQGRWAPLHNVHKLCTNTKSDAQRAQDAQSQWMTYCNISIISTLEVFMHSLRSRAFVQVCARCARCASLFIFSTCISSDSYLLQCTETRYYEAIF